MITTTLLTATQFFSDIKIISSVSNVSDQCCIFVRRPSYNKKGISYLSGDLLETLTQFRTWRGDHCPTDPGSCPCRLARSNKRSASGNPFSDSLQASYLFCQEAQSLRLISWAADCSLLPWHQFELSYTKTFLAGLLLDSGVEVEACGRLHVAAIQKMDRID